MNSPLSRFAPSPQRGDAPSAAGLALARERWPGPRRFCRLLALHELSGRLTCSRFDTKPEAGRLRTLRSTTLS